MQTQIRIALLTHINTKLAEYREINTWIREEKESSPLKQVHEYELLAASISYTRLW